MPSSDSSYQGEFQGSEYTFDYDELDVRAFDPDVLDAELTPEEVPNEEPE